jgi:hypothetical protein
MADGLHSFFSSTPHSTTQIDSELPKKSTSLNFAPVAAVHEGHAPTSIRLLVPPEEPPAAGPSRITSLDPVKEIDSEGLNGEGGNAHEVECEEDRLRKEAAAR